MTESEAREAICRIGASLFARGHAHATAGNISVRLDEGDLLITPTDACLGTLDPAQLALLGSDLQQRSGPRASKTAVLHAQIYRAARRFDAGTRCVIHTHATHCVALSLDAGVQGELLPPITPYFVMKVGHVPLIEYQRPGSAAAAEQVVRTIEEHGQAGRPIRAVMLRRLGPNVWHDTPAAAMAVLEELEETARLCLVSPVRPQPLTEPQIDELRQSFGARW